MCSIDKDEADHILLNCSVMFDDLVWVFRQVFLLTCFLQFLSLRVTRLLGVIALNKGKFLLQYATTSCGVVGKRGTMRGLTRLI